MRAISQITTMISLIAILAITTEFSTPPGQAFWQPAHAWGHCYAWFRQDVGKPRWFDVTNRFRQSEILRLNHEWPMFRILESRICMSGGGDVCRNNDLAVSQWEVRDGIFREYDGNPQF